MSARNLSQPIWIKVKGLLFLVAGVMSSLLVFLGQPTLRVAFLLTVAVWAFCRFYYFAFYVIERYVDPRYRFSGLSSLIRYLIRERRRR